MKLKVAMSFLAVCGLATTASANIPFSGNGPGGPIPAGGTGGGVWDTTLPPDPFDSIINVPLPVKSITSIEMQGLTHTWIGDLQAVLFDPNGVGYNIWVRPGFTGTGFGNSGDFIGGNYTFHDPTSGHPTLPTAGDAAPGNYSQSSSTGSGVTWTSGNHNIHNDNFSTIGGPAGNWRLVIFDWAAGDTGSMSGWTLNANLVPAPGAIALLGLAGLVARRRRRN